MPISYTIHRESRLVVARFTGFVTDDEYIRAYETIFSDPDCSPGFSELSDLREIDNFDVSRNGLQIVAARAKRFHGDHLEGTRVADVVATALQLGMSRMSATYADMEGAEANRTFYDVKEALEWLGAAAIPVDAIHKNR